MRAARFLRISPVELEQLPIEYRQRALLSEAVEAEVAAERERRRSRKAARKSGGGLGGH